MAHSINTNPLFISYKEDAQERLWLFKSYKKMHKSDYGIG
jgi:hypothetical protein